MKHEKSREGNKNLFCSCGASTVVLAILFCALFASNGAAQISTGSINGTVTDSSGATVPGATVVLQNLSTAVKRDTQTNAAGVYALLDIPPGRYTLQVSKTGFQTAQETNILVQVNLTATYDFALHVGTTQTMVTVSATAAALEASTSELGTAVETRAVNDLPLNGRNFTELLILTPGVSMIQATQTIGFTPIGTIVYPDINGQRGRSNFYFLDGLANYASYGNSYAFAPPVDDIQEFKVQSHNDSAQFGAVTGGVINVVTKSGTNRFHATLWDFLRNNDLDSRSPFQTVVPIHRQNEFGGTVGGPVILPHYNGKDKTFFFFSYEGFRSYSQGSSLYIVPSASDLEGNLSDLGGAIYNPYTTTPDPNHAGEYLRTPFTGNQIPTNLLNSVALAYATQYVPAAFNTGVSGFNGENTFLGHTFQNEYSVRGDHTLSDKTSLWFRYSWFSQPVENPGSNADVVNAVTSHGYNIGGGLLHSFGPSATVQVVFGTYQAGLQTYDQTVGATNTSIAQLGFATPFNCALGYGPKCIIPSLSVTGYFSNGSIYDTLPAGGDWEWKGDFSKVHGRHTFQAGADMNKMTDSTFLGPGAIDDLPSETFTSFETSNLETSTGGNAIASFLLGVPDSASYRSTDTRLNGGWVDGFYFQDQWKATSRLTVNGGVRYDFTLRPILGLFSDGSIYTGDYDASNGTYVLQALPPSCTTANAAPCIPGGTLPANVVVTPLSDHAIYHNVYDNISPRLGLAYRLGSKTVLRASSGRFFDNWSSILQSGQNYSGSWPLRQQLSAATLNPTVPAVFMNNPLASQQASPLPPATPFGAANYFQDPYIKNPESWQWNIGIQRQLGANTLATVNYVGSVNYRLDIEPFENTAVTPGPGAVSSRAPFPYMVPTQWDTSVGRAHYAALQAQLKQTFSNGLTYLISYTWSKDLGIGCDDYYCVYGGKIENAYDLNQDKGVTSYDLTQDFTSSIVYQLPFGYAGRFQTHNRALDQIIGGWQANTIITFTSGAPFTVLATGDIANIGNTSYERLNLIGNPKLSHPTTAEWFNTAAYAPPAPYTFGNEQRNSLRGNDFKNVDASLFRKFRFKENTQMEFRLEAFNSTNTPTMGTPGTTYGTSTFGVVSSTRSTARQVQLALKLYF